MKKYMKNILKALLLAVLIAGGMSQSNAQLLNGSFELGNDLSPSGTGTGFEYNVPGASWNAGIGGVAGYLLRYYQNTVGAALFPQSGDYALSLGQQGQTAGDYTILSQGITGLSIGQQYTLSGFTNTVNLASQSSVLTISGVNAGTLGVITGGAVATWTSFNYNFTVTQATETINFLWQNLVGSGVADRQIVLDNITVALVPEPSSYALLLMSGIFVLVVMHRRVIQGQENIQETKK
jgi:hypothetical protein